MPNLPTHLCLAWRTSSRLAHPVVEGHLGSFLLGSTSPDIRIITKWKRDQTHFAPLAVDHVGAGVEGLLNAHPHLADSSRIDDATRAFLSGYFTHLVADETWIVEIYRPYFNGHRPGDQVRANIWDRALQLDMDMAARERLGDFEQIRASLEGSEQGIEVGFISPETLTEWREWVSKFNTWDLTWERLRFMARRMYSDDSGAAEIVDEFLRCVPDSLGGVYGEIPRHKIAEYQERVVEESARLIKGYLGAPEAD